MPARTRYRPVPFGGIGTVALLAAVGAGCEAGPGADGRPTTHQVSIRAFEYVPPRADVKVGDTLVWLNEDIVPHTATAVDRGWDTGSIAAGDSARQVVEAAGAHEYICAFHPQMRGTLAVVPP